MLIAMFLAALLAAAALAPAQDQAPGQGPPPIAGEQELSDGVRAGRLRRDALVRQGRSLSYLQRLRLYYYAQELEPYFLGVEEAIRDLARTSISDAEGLAQGRRRLYEALQQARARLAAAQRPGLEIEWRRGLTGLIYLDFDWRDRVAEQKKNEIKNPYDLAALLDCLDARLRGLEKGALEGCPAAAGGVVEDVRP
ncbi:MAG: hypothetical protein C4525_15745 [Desulfarculus sp.]|nr:MAG: hypothetical protein C4525_15745 [Desulfarculus sp.]